VAETRLTQLATKVQPAARKAAAHNFRRLNGNFLVTHEGGEHVYLSEKDYGKFLEGTLSKDAGAGKALHDKGFMREYLDFQDMGRRSVARNLLDWPGPSVHTIVVTLRCNYKCLYCHASVVDPSRFDKDMTIETARQVVDFAFQSPNPEMMLEFQGGEPLINWPVVKFVVQYARRKNKLYGKTLHIGLISNFSLLDDERLDFLIENGVSFCSSLDGPEDLHNKNRVYLGGNSHAQVVANLKKVLARREAGAKVDIPNAICTITKHSLPRAKEIVDQLVGMGIERIQLGPLDPVGYALNHWDEIGYTSKEFLTFYEEALDYVIALNKKGHKVYEKMAMIFLVRILEGGHWRFPNGDALARLAYDYDGSIYTSEEGRLLANAGDPFFKIGHAGAMKYQEVFDHPTVRASLLAANGNTQPQCFQCAYQPYCTVQPVFNYETQGGLWGRMPENAWCEKLMGIFDLLFKRLAKPESREVLESWLTYQDR
jgi:uncharacterized protein